MPLRHLFVDMNAFFASVEQQDNPALRGKPVAVVPVMARTTCCLAVSYEGKAKGVKTGKWQNCAEMDSAFTFGTTIACADGEVTRRKN